MSTDQPESKQSNVRANASKASQKPSPDRLAAALRDNLKRRKDQARARRPAEPGRGEG